MTGMKSETHTPVGSSETGHAPEPLRYTGYLIRRAQQAHVAAWTRLVSDQITSVQYSIIATLDRLGEASQRELCDEVDLDRSTIADVLRRMERRDLISRRRSPADARRNVVVLTQTGRSEHERLRPRVEQVERELTGSLSKEDTALLRRQLRALLAAAAPVPDDAGAARAVSAPGARRRG